MSILAYIRLSISPQNPYLFHHCPLFHFFHTPHFISWGRQKLWSVSADLFIFIHSHLHLMPMSVIIPPIYSYKIIFHLQYFSSSFSGFVALLSTCLAPRYSYMYIWKCRVHILLILLTCNLLISTCKLWHREFSILDTLKRCGPFGDARGSSSGTSHILICSRWFSSAGDSGNCYC